MPAKFLARSPLALLCICGPAFAEARLMQSVPASESTIAAPKTVKLTFSDKIAIPPSTVALSMRDGMALSTRISLSDDGKTIIARPTGPFMAGQWTMSWHAVSAGDGKMSEGSLSFTIK